MVSLLEAFNSTPSSSSTFSFSCGCCLLLRQFDNLCSSKIRIFFKGLNSFFPPSIPRHLLFSRWALEIPRFEIQNSSHWEDFSECYWDNSGMFLRHKRIEMLCRTFLYTLWIESERALKFWKVSFLVVIMTERVCFTYPQKWALLKSLPNRHF